MKPNLLHATSAESGAPPLGAMTPNPAGFQRVDQAAVDLDADMRISGSRAPCLFLVELGASISVASTNVPSRKRMPFSSRYRA